MVETSETGEINQMPDMDLATALNMFKSGAQDLFTQRAITGANDQVNQIKSSEMDQASQRQATQNIANQLTVHLASIGTPATTMQAVAGAMGPKQYADANAMNKDAILTGNTQLGDQAADQQTFEADPKRQLAMIKAQARATAMNDPYRQIKLDDAQEKEARGTLDKFGQYLNPNAASGRSAFGIMAGTGQKADRVQALLGDPSTFGNATAQDATLVGEGLGNMVKNGVLTEHESQVMFPDMAAGKYASIKTYLASNPQALQAPGLFQKFQDILTKEKNQNQMQQGDEILQRATERQGVATMQGGKYMSDFKRQVASKLSAHSGEQVNPDDVIIDPKNGVTTVQRQAAQAKADQAGSYIKQAYAAMQGTDPAAQKDASTVFQRFGLDPSMSQKQALGVVANKFKRGDY
jgi:hypothetical protein